MKPFTYAELRTLSNASVSDRLSAEDRVRLSELAYAYMDLAKGYEYLSECVLATKEGLEMVKRTPKHELKRHTSIAAKLTEVAKRHLSPEDLRGSPRLAELLK